MLPCLLEQRERWTLLVVAVVAPVNHKPSWAYQPRCYDDNRCTSTRFLGQGQVARKGHGVFDLTEPLFCKTGSPC